MRLCRNLDRSQSSRRHRKCNGRREVSEESKSSVLQSKIPQNMVAFGEPMSLLVPEPIRQTVIDLDHCSQIKIGCCGDAISQSKSGVDGSQRSTKRIIAEETSTWNVLPIHLILTILRASQSRWNRKLECRMHPSMVFWVTRTRSRPSNNKHQRFHHHETISRPKFN